MHPDWPIYYKDKLIVGNLESNVGVATLWMPKENVASELSSDSFSVCGQLYTKRGINPMLRNILANPLIRYIVLCGVDRQGSGEALVRFFEGGVDEKSGKSGELLGWKIIGDDEALLEKEIPLEAFESVRKNVQILDMRMKPLREVAELVNSLEKKNTFGEPQIFDSKPPSKAEIFPSDLSVFKIRRDYIGDAWLDMLKILNRFGVEIPGMYGKVKAVHNLSVVIEKEDPKNPKFYDYLKFAKEGLDLYIKGFFDVNKGTEAYTYGERIFDWDGLNQEEIMVEKLKRYPYDRGALAVLWKPHQDNFPPKNTERQEMEQTKGWKVPCLVMILGQCLGEELNLTAVFRNNDVYGAWPLNAFALRKFQQEIATKINKNLGSLTTISHIAEMYEIDWEDSKHIVEQNDDLARTCMYERRSNYLITIEGEDIVIKFISPDGASDLAEFRENGKKPKVARDLCAVAVKEMLIDDLGAACDLGRQLAKAETAVKLGLVFEQDNVLKIK